MEGTLETVTVWTWPDGWRLVRPADQWSFWSLYSRLVTEANYRQEVGDEYRELSKNERGRGCNLFLLRPVPVPAGARTDDEKTDGVCGMIFLDLDEQTGKLLPWFRPGRYWPVVIETLRHVYDVLLGLDLVIDKVFTDRLENLILPGFGTRSGEEQRRNFVKDVGRVVSGASVSNFSTGWGWTPLNVVVGDGGTVTTKIFEKRLFEVAKVHRERHKKSAHRLVVSVPLRDGDFKIEDGAVFDMRPWLTRWNEGPPGGSDVAYWKKQSWPNPIPSDAVRVPWTVSLPDWEEEVTDLDLEGALVQVGAIARDEAEVREVARRRAIPGAPHPGFEVPLLLGEIPTLLVAPMQHLRLLEQDLGTTSC